MTSPAEHKLQVLTKPELFITIFALGAATMVIEIMGTRVIGPVFGLGLFVWSALLSVTLGALAISYYSGGVLADKIGSPRLLAILALVTGALLMVRRRLRSCTSWKPFAFFDRRRVKRGRSAWASARYHTR